MVPGWPAFVTYSLPPRNAANMQRYLAPGSRSVRFGTLLAGRHQARAESLF